MKFSRLQLPKKEEKKLKSAPCEDESIALSINKNCNGFSSFSSPLHQLTLLSASLNSTAKKEKKHIAAVRVAQTTNIFPFIHFPRWDENSELFFHIHTLRARPSLQNGKKAAAAEQGKVDIIMEETGAKNLRLTFTLPPPRPQCSGSAVVLCRLLILLTFFLCRRFS